MDSCVLTRIVLLRLLLCSPHAARADELSHPDCPRPPPGTVEGACEIRAKGPELTEKSPYPLLRWAACVQSKLGLPSANNADAIFFGELRLEFEKEIDANLITLHQKLSYKDKLVLKQEQLAWESASKRADARRAKQQQPEGSLYNVYRSIANLTAPEDRAIELACRIEILGTR
jgi:hypothetical protein